MPSTYSPTYYGLPDSIKNLITLIIRDLNPNEIILFGSRARGDHRENSDFDIAVKTSSPIARSSWAKLQLTFEEEPITLRQVDLIEFDLLNDDYQKRIISEGKVLYAR